jgi:hypothetical protein
MNTLLDNVEKWLNELGISTIKLGGVIMVNNTDLSSLGVTPNQLVIELRTALKANNLSYAEMENRTHIYAI